MQCDLHLSEDGGEGVNEARVCELESSGGEFGGVGSGTGEKNFVGHFAEGEAECKGGDCEKGRAMELSGKGARELCVGGRVGRSEVDGTSKGVGLKKKEDSSEGVGERDPAHVLTAVADLASESKTKDGEQTRKGAIGPEDDSEAEMKDADAGVNRWLSGGLPLLAGIGEKSGADGRCFVD